MHALPEPMPGNPLEIVSRWLDEATRAGRQRNPNAMSLATAHGGRPSVRMVLLKSLSIADGFVVFYTNYRSRKGRELAGNDRAAAALYWPEAGRQVRLEGRVVTSPDAESAAYFASRPLGSQLNAWVSEQSQPLEDEQELQRRLQAKARALAPGEQLQRPPFWGGYRLWLDGVELWAEGQDRFHERVCYQRDLSAQHGSFAAGAWRYHRLQP